MTAAVQKILDEVQALTDSERRELQSVLVVTGSTETQQEIAVVRELAEYGLVTPAQRALRAVQPVPATGRPASEMIVAERR